MTYATTNAETNSVPNLAPNLDPKVAAIEPTSSPGQLRKSLGAAYIKFWLDAQTQAVLPIQDVQEVVTLPAHRLTAMPTMPMPVLGLINRRSRVLWLVDVGLLLEHSQLESNLREYHLIVVQAEGIVLGLAVHQLENMTWLRPETMQPVPSHLASQGFNHFAGCMTTESGLLWVLQASSLVRSPLLHQRC